MFTPAAAWRLVKSEGDKSGREGVEVGKRERQSDTEEALPNVVNMQLQQRDWLLFWLQNAISNLNADCAAIKTWHEVA